MKKLFKRVINTISFNKDNTEEILEHVKIRIQNQKKEIRELKEEIKRESRRGNPTRDLQSQLSTDKLNYRYEHVAYSLLKGKKYKDIEQVVADGNEISMDIVKIIMKMMKKSNFVRIPRF